MKEESQHNPRAERHTNDVSLAKGIGYGLIGSLVGTIAMDIVMVGEFSMKGLPADTYLALIGSVIGGGVPLGVVLHLLLGSLLGLIFGAAVSKVSALRIDTLRNGVVLGVLAGIATIPLCIAFAIIIGTPVATMLSFSTIPHLVWGAVLGVIAGYGLRPTIAA